jgi:hypothetical protein
VVPSSEAVDLIHVVLDTCVLRGVVLVAHEDGVPLAAVVDAGSGPIDRPAL